MRNKIRVGVLFGGRSAEHEVSLMSAKNVINAINKEKYDVTLIGIDKKGRWLFGDSNSFLIHTGKSKKIELEKNYKKVVPSNESKVLINLSERQNFGEIDVVFPVLHGPYGEDGTIQGLLKLASIPFVGAGVLGSAIGMDKDVMKRLLRDAGIPIAEFLVLKKDSHGNVLLADEVRPESLSKSKKTIEMLDTASMMKINETRNRLKFSQIVSYLGLPFFVKPANLGSSVGISKIHNEEEFEKAVDLAFSFDQKILIEEFIKGREIECAVLGNDEPKASLPGEIIPQHEFYDYNAKYIYENGAILKAPADLPEEKVKEVQQLAIKTFQVLCCNDLARVDFFMKVDGTLFVNEINTIPGFTSISMYPKLWEVSGIPQKELIDRLIQLALDRSAKERN